MPDDPEPLDRYLLVAVDIQGYSGQEIYGQHDFQEALHAAIGGAAEDARLDRLAWRKQEQGDGELSLVPAGPDELRMMDAFVGFLRARVQRFNAPRLPEQRMRVRVAFHSGWARRSALGYSGPDVVVVSRLVNAPELKAAMSATPGATVGLVVSDTAFPVVRQGLTTLPADAFRPVDTSVKEFSGHAWVWVPVDAERPGANPPDPAPAHATPAADPARSPQPGPVIHQNTGVVVTGGSIHGPVAAGENARAHQGWPPPAEE